MLPEGCHPKGMLKARCGRLLPMMAMRFAEYSGTKCHLTSVTGAILSLRVDDAGAAVSDLVSREATPWPSGPRPTSPKTRSAAG